MTVTWTLRDGLKWSDGQPLTCDDFKYAWEWVLDKDNVGVVTAGFEDLKAWRLPVADTEMVWHFKNDLRGLHPPDASPRCHATTWRRSR